MPGNAMPAPTSDTQPFRDGYAEGELRSPTAHGPPELSTARTRGGLVTVVVNHAAFGSVRRGQRESPGRLVGRFARH